MEAVELLSGEEGFVIKHKCKNNTYKRLASDSRMLQKCFRIVYGCYIKCKDFLDDSRMQATWNAYRIKIAI